MDKKRLYHIIEWVVALLACGWLAYKMVTYDDYAGLWATISAMSWPQWLALVLCIALMPVNMALEAWRWRTLMNGASRLAFSGERLEDQERMSFREAHRQVYYSKLAGLITPWRLGEYPSRALLMARDDERLEVSGEGVWPRVLSMGVVGSATMTAAIIIAGVPAMMISNFRFMIYDLGFSYIIAISLFLILLVVALYFAPRLLRRWATVSHKLVLVSVGQSLVRLACWCVQLALVLYALGAISNLKSQISNLSIYYLLVTITPNVPIAEVGVRGAWAIVVFGTMNAALAGVLLWVINTLFPCLAWFFFKKK